MKETGRYRISGKKEIIGTEYENLLNETLASKDLQVMIRKSKQFPKTLKYCGVLSPENGLLYFLIKDDEVVYIGSTNALSRVQKHRKTKDFDCATYIECSGIIHKYLEVRLIEAFKTKYNKCVVALRNHY